MLAAAVVHATWNLLAKESRGGVAFVWLATAVGFAAMTPFALLEWEGLDAAGAVAVAVGGVLQTVYFVLLQRGYRAGDLSLVYPLARGTAPLLAMAGGIVLFGERPGIVAIAGGLAICAAVVSLARPGERAAMAYALATGVTIAAYTLWDKRAVDDLDLSPVAYFWAVFAVVLLLLTGPALRRRADLRHVPRRDVLGVGLLGPLSYVLVLFALSTTAVAYVAPAREVSIVIGTALGARLLGEGDRRRRLLASAVIVMGVLAIASG